jgi:cytochrome c biogenesis protein CcmG/thiol:disulfide interchange protein DsbE
MSWRLVLPALAVTLVLGCGGQPDDGAGEDPRRAPALTALTLGGDSVALSDLRGEVVLVNVWATWCVPCRKEAPELQEIHETYGGRGLRVVGVTVDNRGAESEIRRYIADFGITYDIWWDPDGAAIAAFGAVGVPLSVLVDRQGHVAWRHLGAFHAENPALRVALGGAL